jgi:hypothetical protein
MPVEFYFDGNIAGRFADLPQAAGTHRYEPSRSLGHLAMHKELKSGRTPQCSAEIDGKRIDFTVAACVEYGVLDLQNIQITNT